MLDSYIEMTVQKVLRMITTYHSCLCRELVKLHCEICRIDPPTKDIKHMEEFVSKMPTDGWEPVASGDGWGGNGGYAWFRTTFVVPKALEGKELWLKDDVGDAESLYFLNGVPKGMFDYNKEVSSPPRLHWRQLITDCAKAGECFSIVLEAYAGHQTPGCMPFSDYNNNDNIYPYNNNRVYGGISVIEIDQVVADFLMDLRMLKQLYENSAKDSYTYGHVSRVLQDVFCFLPQIPQDYSPEVWHEGMQKALDAMKPIVANRRNECESDYGYVGLIGHSHLDTAWQWPVRETLHKAARTFSNALSVMNYYPHYTFMQSSVLYIEWMRIHYPAIYEGIKAQIAEGRWEPNGGSWVESDNNIPGGEYLIRSFLRGQRYLREHFGYKADCCWQPDTFGYSAALPQILKGCGIHYFLTTKLSWNEANKFPYDSFVWRGIDGSGVLTHFNLTHCWPDVETVKKTVKDMTYNKDVTDMKLVAYGYGDGGGGPSYSMVESANRIHNLRGLPYSEHTTVSEFMHRLENTARDLPVFNGELYLELHRGTLTQKHEIKRSNRKLELAIRNMEMINVHMHVLCGAVRVSETQDLIDGLLINQFHDILPGTCIAEVHELSINQNYTACEKVLTYTKELLANGDGAVTLYNTLSWQWNRQLTLDAAIGTPADMPVQRYVDIDGREKLAIGGVSIAPLAAITLPIGKAAESSSYRPFQLDGQTLITPFATVIFDEAGAIASFITASGREIVRDKDCPLNSFYMGEDVPATWDNWNIDFDQRYKMKVQRRLLSREVVANGMLQLRIRSTYLLGQRSKLIQDMVFYSDDSRVDFETVVDWQDQHNLLKVSFDVEVRANIARHEVQFGYVERPVHDNYAREKVQFEVCNHKWTDLSDGRFGVSILNDCKYGISVDGSDMRLSLHRGGCRPDTDGDKGVHSFTYALLPHENKFSVESVTRPAYELNLPPVAATGYSTMDCGNSFVTINATNVVIETLKFAEDGDGYILRLYEAEGAQADGILKFGISYKAIQITNMLEDVQEILQVVNNGVTLHFSPFEIKTIKIVW